MEVHNDNSNIVTESKVLLVKTLDSIKTPLRKIERMQEIYLDKKNELYSDLQIRQIQKSFETVRQKYVLLDFHLEQLWSLSMISRQKLHDIFEDSLDNLEWDDHEKVIGILFLESLLFQARSFLDVYLFHICLVLGIDNPGYMSVEKFYKHLNAVTNQAFVEKAKSLKDYYQNKVFGRDNWGEILRGLRDKIAHKDCIHPSYDGEETIWGNVLLNWPTLHGMTFERFSQEIVKNKIFEMIVKTSVVLFELEWKSGDYESDLWINTKAIILNQIHDLTKNKTPLELVDLPKPEPQRNEILIKVSTCGVCHTELDEIEGRTPPSTFPMVLGHQVVGSVEQLGPNASKFKMGDRVGVAWIFSACGKCQFCREGNENLCNDFMATGRDAFGGYAEYMTVPEDFAYPIPPIFSDSQAAPLLCAGAIGYRSLRLTNLHDGQNLGLTGFGASAHLVIPMAKYKYPRSNIFVFARSEKEREFAKELGAVWAGDTEDESPEKLDAIIDTTPVWKPVVEALKNLNHEGRLVINAIRKENVDQDYLLKLDYPKHLWMEKEIKSVANVSRRDVSEFLQLAAEIPIKPEVQEFDLKDANKALMELKESKIRGAKVLKIG